MKLVIVTDAWKPQVNGVVTTLANTSLQLQHMGHEVLLLTHEGFRTMPCPGYSEIRLALAPRRKVFRMLDRWKPDAVHIATEGPLGGAARAWCMTNRFPFATSAHTLFPEYIRLRAPVPLSLSYGWMKRFHAPAHTTLVRSETQRKRLSARGFRHLAIWPGAVDVNQFRTWGKAALDLPRPIALFTGRVAVEKGLPAFLDLDLPGSKVIVGGGPDLEKLSKNYPEVHFLGPRYGEELGRLVAAADVFVFPSRTDTLGLVMIEAMACGIPVAAFPVPGPNDVVENKVTGVLDEDLLKAVYGALGLAPQCSEHCVSYARKHSWENSTRLFLEAQKIRHKTLADSTTSFESGRTHRHSPR